MKKAIRLSILKTLDIFYIKIIEIQVITFTYWDYYIIIMKTAFLNWIYLVPERETIKGRVRAYWPMEKGITDFVKNYFYPRFAYALTAEKEQNQK